MRGDQSADAERDQAKAEKADCDAHPGGGFGKRNGPDEAEGDKRRDFLSGWSFSGGVEQTGGNGIGEDKKIEAGLSVEKEKVCQGDKGNECEEFATGFICGV
ncbi:hypothetical protein Rhsp01_20550 [Rhizobium sp. NBRC 114257]|uniref:Uncharacterized protein n=1 Tax=Rhizobium dioscoreae TaxID=2653122 RepID=A0ABQ0Z2C1_9HYPH|nr:hypothetical protein RsS93_20520 [Rhizobium dioscoreae]GLU80879.1 hypothetical protein Rhsp01_20550 [Rhizobium sp. NBRC 114257]